jgi:ABC-type phosphate/phosphonate transport system substrate-binding protein
MPRHGLRLFFLPTALLLLGLGCQTAGFRFLSLIGLERKPLSVALVMDQPMEAAQAFNPFPAYGQLQQALSAHLARPVAVDVCFAFQVESGLENGWYDLAMLSSMQYALLPHAETTRVVVVSVDKQQRIASNALLVVQTNSELQTSADLRGKVVAFGPAGDVRTHYAALKLLADAGLQPTDLSLELLPVPGSLKHMLDGHAVAQSVISGDSAAGFVDEAAWDAFAEHDPGNGEPSREKLRVLGRTIAVPSRIMLASPRLDDAAFEQVRSFALAVGTAHPEVMEPLTSSGYAEPTADLLATCRSLAPPPATQPAAP